MAFSLHGSSVKAHNVRLQDQSGPFLPDGHYVKVSISDQGEGIRMPFYFIDKQNGALSVETEANVGTTFHIYLPASTNPLSEEKGVRQVSERLGRILVMDDEEMMRTLLGKALMRAGYDVDLAKDAEEALSLNLKQR